jgi:hypothetical protein
MGETGPVFFKTNPPLCHMETKLSQTALSNQNIAKL